jgi:hypothetical protein
MQTIEHEELSVNDVRPGCGMRWPEARRRCKPGHKIRSKTSPGFIRSQRQSGLRGLREWHQQI